MERKSKIKLKWYTAIYNLVMFSRKINFGGIFVKARRKKGLRCVTIMISGTFFICRQRVSYLFIYLFVNKSSVATLIYIIHVKLARLNKAQICSWTINFMKISYLCNRKCGWNAFSTLIIVIRKVHTFTIKLLGFNPIKRRMTENLFNFAIRDTIASVVHKAAVKFNFRCHIF